MLKFVLFFPRNRGSASVFVMTSLGGMKIGKLRIPGWEGSGLYLPLIILALKGYRLAGAYPMRYTPENWTSLIPGYGEQSSRYMLAACQPRLEAFLSKLLEGRRCFHGLISAVFGFAIFKISLMYLVMGKFILAKTNFYSSSCSGCGLCAENCPVGAIKMVQGRPYWKYSCESCMRCMNYCARKAVQAHFPLCFFVIFAAVVPLSEWTANFFQKTVLNHALFAWLVSYAVTLAVVLVCYELWFKLLQNSWIIRFFEFTAPTRYYRRYREPDTSLKNIRSIE